MLIVPDRGHKMYQMTQFFYIVFLDNKGTQSTPKVVPKSVKLNVTNLELGFQCYLIWPT